MAKLKPISTLFILVSGWLSFAPMASGQIPLAAVEVPHLENFDVMGSAGTVFPMGWTALRYAGSGTAGQTLTLGVTDGTQNAGNIYNTGSADAADRALGSLASGSTAPRFGAGFQNLTGRRVTAIDLTAVMEQWRAGSSGVVETNIFEYSLQATGINDAAAGWLPVPAMDLVEKLTATTSAGAVDGNLEVNKTNLAGQITDLAFDPGATLWLRWSDRDAAGSDALMALDDLALTLHGETADHVPPALTGNPFTPADGAEEVDPATPALSVTFNEHIRPGTGNIILSNLTDGTTQELAVVTPAQVTLTAATAALQVNLAAGKHYAVQIPAAAITDIAGNAYAGFTGDTTWAFSTAQAGAHNTLQQDFAACSVNLPGGWRQYSVAGDQVWGCSSFGQSNNGVQANGFATTNQANEDWLISPALNLSAFDFPLLHYWSRSRFAGPPLRLMVSVNYSGSGDPYAAGVSWTEVAGQFAPVGHDAWHPARDIDLSAFKQPQVFLAFVYTSTATSGSRWTLDDISITNSAVGPFQTSLQVLSDLDFGTVEAPGASAAKTFTFSVAGLDQSLNLLAPPGFVLSKDGMAYAGNLSYSPAEAAGGNTVYLKFMPPGPAHAVFTGTLRFTNGSEFNAAAGYLSGNTVPQNETFDVVNWNIEWFGAPGGPADDGQQLENARKILTSLDAEVYVLQEIANPQAFRDLVSAMPGYRGFTSPYVSAGSAATAQRLAFIYKTAAVDSVGGRGLLTGAGQAPGFWASGRLPYLFVFDVRINGVRKRIHLVNIHPKANENGSEAEAREAYDRRRFDLQVLKDTLDQYYGRANIILAGDFNDDIDFTVAALPFPTESTYEPFMSDTSRYNALTLPLSKAGLRTYLTFDNVIDHVLVSNEMGDDYLDKSARIVIPFGLVPDFGSTTSDHLPVSTRFWWAEDGATGGDDPAPEAGLQVYPNPATTWLRVSLSRAGAGPAIMSLFDLAGRRVYRRVVPARDHDLFRLISVAELPRNTYLLVLTTPQGTVRQRIILK
jgi:hypothetical protein